MARSESSKSHSEMVITHPPIRDRVEERLGKHPNSSSLIWAPLCIGGEMARSESSKFHSEMVITHPNSRVECLCRMMVGEHVSW